MAPTIHLDPIEAGKQITRGDMHWGETLGAPADPITFGFRSSAPGTGSWHGEQSSFSKFDADDMAMARAALRLWSNVANISFVEVNPGGYTDNATILFANYTNDSDGAGGFAYMPASGNRGASSLEGDIWMNIHWGSVGFSTFLHEIGHALGLNHPGDYAAAPGVSITYDQNAEYVEDSRQYSVMSYFSEVATGADYTRIYWEGNTKITGPLPTTTLRLHDISAIQRLYGANYSFAAGDTTYGFNSNAESEYRISDSAQEIVYSIWDGGGNDTLDFSGYTDDQAVDLGEGRFSDVGSLKRNVSIALGAVIENAVSGSGSDTLVGNSSANRLVAGDGDDRLTGGAGDDMLDGGGGYDTAIFDGNRSEYKISRIGASVLVSGPDGSDELTTIETLMFDDGTVDILDIVRLIDGKASKEEGTNGSTTFSFVVKIAGDTSVSRTVSYSIFGWGVQSADASDFPGGALPSGTLTFAAGESSRIVTVDVAGDSFVEGDETFGMSISDPVTGQAFEQVLATATIKNDDQASVRLSAPSVRELEGNGGTTAFTFIVELDRPSTVTETLSWVAGNWSNVISPDATDFAGSPFSVAQLTFAPGETTKTITVDVAGDTAVEPDELFYVFLHTPSAGLKIVSGLVERTILDDDSLRVFLDTQPISQSEGDTGTTTFSFPVFLTRASSVAQSVRWSVSDSWANGADFAGGVPPSGRITFAAGETTKEILVEVSTDRVYEGNDQFTVTLSDPSPGLGLGSGTATGTIVNDDSPFSISTWSSTWAEGNSGSVEFTFRLQRLGIVSISESISWSVTGFGQNPADASDFLDGILPSGTVTFASNETSRIITVLVAGDRLAEAAEEFAVSLSTPSTGPASGEKWSATGVIFNDDTSVSVQSTAATKAEGQAGATAFTFTLTRSGNIGSAHNVAWAVAGTGATPAAASDFGGGVLPSGLATFAPGQVSTIVTVNVQGDTAVEPDEDFMVTLSSPSTGLTIDIASAGGMIISDDAGVSIAATSAVEAEGQAGSIGFTFTLTRLGSTAIAHSVQWTVDGAGADQVAASDFAGGVQPSGTVTFAPGQGSATVTVDVQGDTAVEADESFVVTLSGPSAGLTIGTATAGGTIINDDTAASVAAVGALKAEGNAGSTAFTFTLTRSGDLAASHSVAWTVAGGGANPAAASDFAGGVLPSGVATFASGQSSTTVMVQIQGDTAIEGDEGFVVTLSDPSPGLAIATSTASGTIVNDDSTVSIAAAGAVKREGSAASTAFVFTVTRSGDIATSQSVAWQAAGAGVDAATASDFAGGVLPSGVMTFASGQSSATITINVAGDMAVEADERFAVTLSNASPGLTIAEASAEGTIVNDDAAASILAAAAVRPEGHAGLTAFTFTLTRSGDIAASHSVAWAVAGTGIDPAGGSDVAGGVLPSGVVTFAAGETSTTVSVNVQGDTAVEGDEGFVIALSSPSAGLTIATATASGTIINDDAAVSVAATAAVLPEGNAGSTVFAFTLTRSGDIAASHSVAWAVAGAGANPAGAADFAGGALPAGTVTFVAGETSKVVMVEVAGEAIVEADEGFTVTLSNPSSGLALGGASASGTIQNDDRSTVSVAARSAVKAEGNAGATASTFVVSLSQAAAVAQTVSWAVAAAGSNPASASDFMGGLLPTGTVTFAAGETSKVVTVSVAGDTSLEADEGFTLTLSNPSAGLVIGTASASGTIQNDDTAPPVAAHGDAYVVKQGQVLAPTQPLSTGVLANDENASTASLHDGPDHGTLQLAGNGTFTYTPAAGFHGVDTFTYQAGNAGSTMGEAQVTIHVVPVSAGSQPTLDLMGLTAEEQIAATYAAFFGRGADMGGFGFWVDQFVSNLPTQGPSALFANIASSFAISAEAKALYPFLVDPFHASDSQINVFLNSVYDNLFNRTPDAGGLGYWTGQVKQALQANQFVGSVLVNIMSGAQDTAAGQDITTLMGKVAVSLAYVREQHEHGTGWLPGDNAAARALLEAVTAEPASVLVGVRNAESLIAGHA